MEGTIESTSPIGGLYLILEVGNPTTRSMSMASSKLAAGTLGSGSFAMRYDYATH
jgi:hypothetical protein